MTDTGKPEEVNRDIRFADNTDMENGHHAYDPEKSQSRRNSRRFSHYSQMEGDLDEYTALQKFISTYRDPRAQMLEDAANEDITETKKPWYAFWKKSAEPTAGDGTLVVPADWLNADIKQGVSSSDVETRRRRFGFNEIASEKENMFLKFVGFFTGPVLYGMYLTETAQLMKTSKLIGVPVNSHGTRCPPRRWSS